jgi:hypothetical protein
VEEADEDEIYSKESKGNYGVGKYSSGVVGAVADSMWGFASYLIDVSLSVFVGTDTASRADEEGQEDDDADDANDDNGYINSSTRYNNYKY